MTKELFLWHVKKFPELFAFQNCWWITVGSYLSFCRIKYLQLLKQPSQLFFIFYRKIIYARKYGLTLCIRQQLLLQNSITGLGGWSLCMHWKTAELRVSKQTYVLTKRLLQVQILVVLYWKAKTELSNT